MSPPSTPAQSTPKKRRLEDGGAVAIAGATTSTPSSSLRGALSGIRSWLSPWRGNSRTSAAFGHSTHEDISAEHENDVEEGTPSADVSNSIYPPLPSHATMPALNRRRESPPPIPFTFTPPTQPAASAPRSHEAPNASSSSPLSRNYALLARFFAEKAAEEAGTSMRGDDDDGNRLTEDEVEGCRILIEESGRSPRDLQRRLGMDSGEEPEDSFEVPKRRGMAAKRPRGTGSWLSPSPAVSREGTSFSMDRSPLVRGGPSSVLSHSMTDPGLSRRAPLASSSTANPFLSGRTTASQQPVRRRRRPLYFGPGMSSTASPFAPRPQAATRDAAPSVSSSHQPALGKRQRLGGLQDGGDDDDDDNVPPSTSIANLWQPPPQDRPVASSSRVAQATAPSPASSPAKQEVMPRSSGPSSPAQTRTASAVLSILAQPDLARPTPSPVRRTTRPPAAASSLSSSPSMPSASTSSNGFRPDGILNPYQASPELNLGQSSQSSMRRSRTSEAVAKMKDERRRSTRLRRSAAPDESSDTSAGLLETIERTKPAGGTSTRRGGTRESSRATATATPEPARVSFAPTATAPSASPSPSTGKTAAEKTAEAKRRLDAMSAAKPAEGEASSSDNLVPPRSAPSTPPSFNFGKHAPPKPSRLSIAFNANDSPGNTETADEEEEEEDEQVGAGEESDMSIIKSSQPVASAKSTFAFGGGMGGESSAHAQQATKAAATSSAPTRVGNDSSKPAPFTFSAPAKTSSPAPAFTAPAFNAPSAPASTASQSSTASTPRERALETDVASLPTFDLRVSVTASTPSWYARSATTEEEQRRQKASSTAAADLPKFDLLQGDANTGEAMSSTTAPQTVISKQEQHRAQAQATSATQLPTFNLFGNGNGTQASKPAAAPPAASQSAQAAVAAEPAPSGGETSEGSGEGSSSSALLGSGEGEEGETTVFEVRAKFWKFASAKWEDLGVGIARVKRPSSTAADQGGSPRRLLVRNAGNGAVTVNFNLFPDFKATQSAQSLGFTGFDAEGKGQPMRCKVKTADSAGEFVQVLEREAKLS
ncbi:hypothetical protein BDZ90DRAFT_232804 [Jaminaea rosea]|uniref:RanBD1 domain-containing protein n=1 Tax=Jaminaea rosea TaxID=1569628 RepID=A0A316UMZ1_9BASI|nr:hypothetical protein BDZ90DRAFT_232804 [Jaminaea rosea]PWN26672.1 hypothetical protein BDZ90DRAFT_232804 [Jaminaea rosea]